MRFTTVVLTSVLAVFASAQSSATAKESEVATATVGLTPAQSSMYACVDKCDDGDVDCQSHCIAVPSPNEQQVNATTECVAACPQGDGSAADTQKYATCINNCIAQNYYVTSEGTPRATGGSSNAGSSAAASGTGSESAASATGAAASSGSSASGTASSGSESSSTGTATGSAASSTSTGNAAHAVAVGSVSVLGLIAAVLAL